MEEPVVQRTRRKNPWRFMPLLVLAAALLSAAFSQAEGWRRYAALIGMGGGIVLLALWAKFIQPRLNDRRYLSLVRDEVLPVIELMRAAAAEATFVNYISHALKKGGFSCFAGIHPEEGPCYRLSFTEQGGRCSIDYQIDDQEWHKYPDFPALDISFEPWLREPLRELFAVLNERKDAQDRHTAEIMAFLDTLKTPPS